MTVMVGSKLGFHKNAVKIESLQVKFLENEDENCREVQLPDDIPKEVLRIERKDGEVEWYELKGLKYIWVEDQFHIITLQYAYEDWCNEVTQ